MYCPGIGGGNPFVSQQATLVLSRYMPLEAFPAQADAAEPVLRVGLVVANPRDEDYGPVAADAVVRTVRKLDDRDDVSVNLLDDATPSGLVDWLREFRPHVMHFIGHGGYDRGDGSAKVILVEDNGESRDVTDSELGEYFREADHTPTIVVLHLPDVSTGEVVPNMARLGPALIRAGVPAVVAMQHPFPVIAAQCFIRAFYDSLANEDPIDFAVSRGRVAYVREVPGATENRSFGTPVLFARAYSKVIAHPAGADAGGDPGARGTGAEHKLQKGSRRLGDRPPAQAAAQQEQQSAAEFGDAPAPGRNGEVMRSLAGVPEPPARRHQRWQGTAPADRPQGPCAREGLPLVRHPGQRVRGRRPRRGPRRLRTARVGRGRGGRGRAPGRGGHAHDGRAGGDMSDLPSLLLAVSRLAGQGQEALRALTRALNEDDLDGARSVLARYVEKADAVLTEIVPEPAAAPDAAETSASDPERDLRRWLRNVAKVLTQWQLEDAARVAERPPEVPPRLARAPALMRGGIRAVRAGRHADARDMIDMLLRAREMTKRPRHLVSSSRRALLLVYLGRIDLFVDGDLQRASERFAAAARLAPDDPVLHAALGSLLQARGDADQALALLPARDHRGAGGAGRLCGHGPTRRGRAALGGGRLVVRPRAGRPRGRRDRLRRPAARTGARWALAAARAPDVRRRRDRPPQRRARVGRRG